MKGKCSIQEDLLTHLIVFACFLYFSIPSLWQRACLVHKNQVEKERSYEMYFHISCRCCMSSSGELHWVERLAAILTVAHKVKEFA